MSVSYPPISDYALIGDCHSAALVSRDGSVDWCCFHRFDSPPVFSRILDWQKGGHIRISPSEPYEVSRRYFPNTNVLETRFEAAGGVVLLVDCFVVEEDTTKHPPHQLLRWLYCERGEVAVDVELSPRFDYGRTIPTFEQYGNDLGVVYGGSDALVIQSEVLIEQHEECVARGHRELKTGEEFFVSLTHSLPHELQPMRIEPDEAARRLETTKRYWSDWADRCTYEGPYRDHVVRSALVLKALTNSPTGAIVAAPTTSLPEEVGGIRNWDYRYAWLRDAALNLYALFKLGYIEEARAFMGWLRRTTAGRAEDLQILYGIGGERFLPELELGGLDGYRGSKPVRVGNAATDQFQLDVYGYLLDTAWLYHRHGGEINEEFWAFLSGTIDVVAARWTQPDNGIWEVRGGLRHFVTSKVFAWVAVDRAIRLARALDLPADLARWEELRTEIRRRVLEDGVDQESKTFRQSFGDAALDASTLLVPLVRFLPGDDERVVATMEQIASKLAPDGLVYRYLEGDDGLPGGEATFAICSFWLVDNLALAGEVERSRKLFERLLGHCNDVGLLAEEIDPRNGEFYGNFPQAFSHVGLIGAALNLERAGPPRPIRDMRR